MRQYNANGHKRRWPKILVSVFLVLAVLTAGTVLALRREYNRQLQAVSSNQTQKLVTIPLGSTLREISTLLAGHGLIRKSWAFEWYVNSLNSREKLQAGTYSLQPSQSVAEIVAILTHGKIKTDLVTILPGKRLDEIRQGFINDGFNQTQVDAALRPEQYENHPALVDKPKGSSLEGYLYPESFQKTTQTTPDIIIRQSLDEMQKYLTPELRAGLISQGLNVYQGITLASIIEKEVSHVSDKPQVAQVFLGRLRRDQPLESDPTAFYGAILAGEEPSLSFDSPHNTYKHRGLPPTPIGNVSLASLQAVAMPAATDWIYFVAGDDGTTHFSKTLEEHQNLTQKYCKKLCQ